MSYPTELPWHSICTEVSRATATYMEKAYGTRKDYIKVKYLADYIFMLSDDECRMLYPHFYGESYRTIANRCSLAMRKMGWGKFTIGVYMVKWGNKDGIIKPILV